GDGAAKMEKAKEVHQGLQKQQQNQLRLNNANRDRRAGDMKDMDADIAGKRLREMRGDGFRPGARAFPGVGGARFNGQPMMLGGRNDGWEQAASMGAVPLIVREYAHHHERANPNVRDDYAETIYWHPVLVAQDGKAEVSFQLSDSLTTFQVLA